MTEIGGDGIADLEALLEASRRRLQDFEDGVDRARLIDRLREASPAHPILLARTAFALLAGALAVCALFSFLLPFINRDVAKVVARIDQVVSFKPEGVPGLPFLLLLVALCMFCAYVFATFAALSVSRDTPMMAWEARQHQKLVNEITRLQTQKAVMARIQRSPRGRTPLPMANREQRFDATPAGVMRSRAAQGAPTLAGRGSSIGAGVGSSALLRASTGTPAWPRSEQPPVATGRTTGAVGMSGPPRLDGVRPLSGDGAATGFGARPAQPLPYPQGAAPQPSSAFGGASAGHPVHTGLGGVRPERSAPMGASAKSGTSSPIGVLGARTARVPISATGPGGRPSYARTPGSRIEEAPRVFRPEHDTTPVPDDEERIQVADRQPVFQAHPPMGALASVGATARGPSAPLGVQTRSGAPLGQALRTGRSLAASAVAVAPSASLPESPSESEDEDVGDLPTALRVSIQSLRKRAEGPAVPAASIVEGSTYISARQAELPGRHIPQWGAIDEPWLEEGLQRAEKLTEALPKSIQMLFSPEDDLPFALVLTGAGPAQAVRAMIQFVEFLRAIPTPSRARIEMGLSESLGRNVSRALEPYFHDEVQVEHGPGRVDLVFRAPDPGWSAYRRLPIV